MGWMTEESWFDSRQGCGIFLFSENIQTGSWAYPTYYSTGTRGFCSRSKADAAWSSLLNSILCQG